MFSFLGSLLGKYLPNALFGFCYLQMKLVLVAFKLMQTPVQYVWDDKRSKHIAISAKKAHKLFSSSILLDMHLDYLMYVFSNLISDEDAYDATEDEKMIIKHTPEAVRSLRDAIIEDELEPFRD